MTRRGLIMLVGAMAAAWPRTGRAQQPKPMRRIGVLPQLSKNGSEDRKRMAAFLEGLSRLGWRDDKNVRVGHRHALGKLETTRAYAAELAAAPLGIELIPIGLRRSGEIERASQ
jgi:hypothetical protein